MLDGFWLPRAIRDRFISPQTEYETRSYTQGRPCQAGDEGAITARWPRFRLEQWQTLLAALRQNRQQAPASQEFWERLQAALQVIGRRFADPADPLRQQALGAIPGYTGYSEAMIRFTLSALDLMSLEQMPAAFRHSPSQQTARDWQAMPGLPGRLRFYPASAWQRSLPGFSAQGKRPLFGHPLSPDLVVGYGAGNVPGAALIIAFLAWATTLAGGPPPVVVIKNSRREPIFSALVLAALEDADPGLVAATAILAWDYEDSAVQDFLLPQADLVVAAASDETIAQIKTRLDKAARHSSHSVRFHAHGHKVSFSAIGKELLAYGLADPSSGQPMLEVIALLAALDSIFWDQHGCLSSRIHFVETGESGFHTPLEYAAHLAGQLRMLASVLPRGAWPRQQLHDRFDRYKGLETTSLQDAAGQVRVLSNYDDEFVVALDQRPLSASAFYSAVNDCQGRVILVRPVADLMEIPERYLRQLPAANLQSLSVAVGCPGEELTERFLRFAAACGRRGVTAIRTVGRGAFPQLSYSWDGLLPLDLLRQRPAGYFTTLEFDVPYEQILNTYQLYRQRTVTTADP